MLLQTRPGRRPRTPVLLLLAAAAALPALTACGGGGDDGGSSTTTAPLLSGYTDNPALYTVAETIAPNLPQFTGNVTSWSVVPALPGGLSLDPITGVISGSPAAAAPSTMYTVTATNADGTDTLDVEIEVVQPSSGLMTEMASRSAGGAPGNAGSSSAAMSSDGQWVAFDGFASNLVAGDTNGQRDVFLRQLSSGDITRVSVDSAGQQTVGDSSFGPDVDADGSAVVFTSSSDALATNDSNGENDVYVHLPASGVTELVSVDLGGGSGAGASDDASISGDGQRVAFESDAPDLVVGDTNGDHDIFVRDRLSNTTTRVSVSSSGVQGNDGSFDAAIARDVNIVAFRSVATNLDFGDTNLASDVFIHDLDTGITVRMSETSTGAEANGPSASPDLSADGRYVVFSSDADNLVFGDNNGSEDIFVKDRFTSLTTRVSVSSSGAEGNGDSRFPTISDDGRYVTFDSLATNLVAGDTNGVRDIFRHDRQTGETVRISVATDGTEASEQSYFPSASGDAATIAFTSRAVELDGPTNNATQVFTTHVTGALVAAATSEDPPTIDPVRALVPGHRSGALTIGRELCLAEDADPLDWTVEGGPDWVLVTPAAGALEPGDAVTLRVELRPGGLPTGEYAFDLTVRSGEGGVHAVLPVRVAVD